MRLQFFVVPAEAGTQGKQQKGALDPRLRGGDEQEV